MTTNRTTTLIVDDSQAMNGVRSAILRRADGRRHTLTYQCYTGPLDPETHADPFLLAFLLLMMKAGEDTHVAGSVSRRTLRNVNEIQRMWSKWAPSDYSFVRITADEVREERLPMRDAGIAAFSGGVDSLFTLASTASEEGHAPKRGVLFVHGFDIPLSKPDVFEAAQRRAEPVLSQYEVESHAVSSDIRALDVPWEHVHGLAIASCLSLFAGRYSTAFIGSGKSYDELIFPWGSSPVSDHLFATGDMDMWHDGAAYSRTEKIAALLASSMPLDGLRVCYKGTAGDENCGRCEKCIRTYFSFCAAGDPSPSCFINPPRRRHLRLVIVRSRRQLAEIESVRKYARENGARGPWLNDMRFAILLNRAILPITGHKGFWQAARRGRALFRAVAQRNNA